MPSESAQLAQTSDAADRTARVLAAQADILYGNAPIGTTAAMFCAVLLGAYVYAVDAAMLSVVVVWVGLLAVAFLAHLALCRAYRERAPLSGDWRFWSRTFALACAAEGVIWGLGAVALMATGGVERELAVMLIVAPVAAAASIVYGPFLSAYLAFMLPTMAPFFVRMVVSDQPGHWLMAGLDLWYMLAFSVIRWRSNLVFQETLNLRFANQELAEGLRDQTHRAEEASIAKSRFLASASHDLRQPVHALSMFMGALQGREMDAEARRISRQMESSLSALDVLFVTLLDISKIDAGVVENRPRAFKAQPLLARIVGDHLASAEKKGLGLRLVPSAFTLDCDPILLERIVRNIVTNAIRFTERGRVVVGCRRRGAQVRIDVVDTGPGLPPQEIDRVFDEFYQLGNLERDRARGLGLGLAIVARLSLLMDCPVAVRSNLGSGSTFSVFVPMANGGAPIHRQPAPAAHKNHSGLVLVIDDETMVQQAVGALLRSWGFGVIAAGSCDEMLAQLAESDQRPRLILCDYRLRGNENGIDTIHRLQARFGTAGGDCVPALLITGDIAPERLRESAASGIDLLHKPVDPNVLRAAIKKLCDGEAAAHVDENPGRTGEGGLLIG